MPRSKRVGYNPTWPDFLDRVPLTPEQRTEIEHYASQAAGRNVDVMLIGENGELLVEAGAPRELRIEAERRGMTVDALIGELLSAAARELGEARRLRRKAECERRRADWSEEEAEP